jgi:hypothetical protein
MSNEINEETHCNCDCVILESWPAQYVHQPVCNLERLKEIKQLKNEIKQLTEIHGGQIAEIQKSQMKLLDSCTSLASMNAVHLNEISKMRDDYTKQEKVLHGLLLQIKEMKEIMEAKKQIE